MRSVTISIADEIGPIQQLPDRSGLSWIPSLIQVTNPALETIIKHKLRSNWDRICQDDNII